MQKFNLQFELNEEQLEKRNKLIKQLLNDNRVIQFLKDNSCPPSVVEQSPGKFAQWINELERMDSLETTDLLNDPDKGYFTDLTIDDGLLLEVMRIHPKLAAIQKNRQFTKNYLISDLPETLKFISYDNIKLSDTSTTKYLSAVKTLSMFNPADNEKGFYLFGKPGVGKTFLMACLSNDLARKGHRVAFVNVPALMGQIKRLFDQNQAQRNLIKTLYTVPFLFLDDIGAELITGYNRDEILLPILNERIESKKTTFFTSNYDIDGLFEQYAVDIYGKRDEIRSERLLSRIKGMVDILPITGIDMRFQNNR